MSDRLFEHEPVPPEPAAPVRLPRKYVDIGKRRLPEARDALAGGRARNPWRF